MMKPAVELKDVTKNFGGVEVIKSVSLSIDKGEFVSLLGPSGCGKTTLLRMIAGLEGVSSGAVLIAGQDATHLPPERRDIAMVFQSYALLPHLSVRENVMFPLRMRRIGSRTEQEERVAAALETVHLAPLASRKPKDLSGGQQQRVALARAIVSGPEVLLLDEPLSNLDARLREEMQEELIQLHRQTGLTTVFVTHDQEEAFSLSDRVVLLNGGKIEQQGAPADLYAAPSTRFAATFMGSANILDATVDIKDGQPLARLSPDVALPLASGIGIDRGPATLLIRQEDIEIRAADGGDAAEAIVQTKIFLGARTRYVLMLGGQELRCLAPADARFDRGARIALKIHPSRIRALPGHA